MDAPSPTQVPEPASTETRSSRSSRRRRLAAAGVAGAVVISGLGAVGLAGTDDQAAPNRHDRTVADLIAETAGTDSSSELGDLTLDELADELAELGLEVRLTPADAEEPAEGSDNTAEGSDETDPFAGMTDAEIDALSDEEFSAMLDEAGWTIDDDGWIVPEDEVGSADDGPAADDHDHGSFDDTAAVFTVDGDTITRTSGDADAVSDGEAIWQRFVELIPADQRSMLVGFEVIAEEGGGGYVYPDDNDPTVWHMGISPGLGEDLDWVLIHEFAHLLTLQADQVPPGTDDGSCPTYHTGEGCSLKGSTMNEFVERFWPASQIEEILSAQENEDWDALDAFYADHEDDFVTDYATTNPAEDLAETFTVFVLNDRPTGDTIADQKIQFLWNDPDLVDLRERIRAAL